MSRIRQSRQRRLLSQLAGLLVWGLGTAGSASAAESEKTLRRMADLVHTVIEADRTVYAQHVVNRLQNQDKVIVADEHFKDKKALPLPAQMFRMAATEVAKKKMGLTYALLSLFPIEKTNLPKTEAERRGLTDVGKNPGEVFYKIERLGKQRYFTAVYADIAVSPTCVSCHNTHKTSPKKDWKVGDVMGGTVIRIAVDK